ncbi:hypothetical protein N9L47_11410 [Rhodobacteraceae bacterium]|nr:hypothetical protein [Paracoccaceae bacterium]
MHNWSDTEKAAIMERIQAESQAFWEKNWDAWVQCWVHEPYAKREGWWSLGGITQVSGWDAIQEKTRRRFDENPQPNRTAQEFSMENIFMRIGSDMAWITYDLRAPNTGEPEMDMPGLTHEAKILEKHDGEWLLAYVGYLHHSVHQVDYPLIQVDSTGRVLWSNEHSAKAMEQSGALRVIAGRICASNRSDNKRLRDVIGWAASLCDEVDSQSGCLPVVLQSYEESEHQLCWVLANSGKIYVAINNDELTEQRLSAAALIHGLTPAQLKLAREVIAGYDLPAAAEKLGVSSTTLRTQLQRIYDKVGVRTQPALVRVLMSAAAPTMQM